MKYKIEKKDAFTVVGTSKKVKYTDAEQVIPQFWQEHYKSGNGKYVCGMFGINIDSDMNHNDFEYMIADTYNPASIVPEGFETKIIPAQTWAVFPCHGPMPEKIQETMKKVFAEWLPSNNEYELVAGYCVEMYDNPLEYKKGTRDEDYYCELWMSVRKKKT